MNKGREVPIIIVRKKIYAAGHHGGAWKVAFADFMTTMMALFLVLWIVTQSSDVRAAIAGYFQDPLGRAHEFGSSLIQGTGGASQGALGPETQEQLIRVQWNRLQDVSARIQNRLAGAQGIPNISDYIEIILTDEGLRIELLEDAEGVFFELGSPTPSSRGREILTILGAELASLPNPVVLEGHTDAERFTGRRDYSNWELSTDRANVARRIMISGGLAEAQVRQVRGHADRELRYPDDPRSPRNRRVTITMLLEYNLASPTGPASDVSAIQPSG